MANSNNPAAADNELAAEPRSGGGGGSRLSFVQDNHQSNTLVASSQHHGSIPSTVKRKAQLNKAGDGRKEGSALQKRGTGAVEPSAHGSSQQGPPTRKGQQSTVVSNQATQIVSLVNQAVKKEQLHGNATSNVEKISNQSPNVKKKANRDSFLNQTEPLLLEKDTEDPKAAQKKLVHQNTMPKVVEKDGDENDEQDDTHGGEDSKSSAPLPADNAINKTQMINEVFD